MTNQPVTRKQTELLAPAGSLEAFFAAMEKGADAVYAGLREFSARAKAKNFTLPQMERMSAYAHGLDRKVYVTLNTLVKENELPRLVETLAALEAMGVDGVILQDLAVARLARNHFPGLALHASTQMTIHNSLGVKQLEELGFERVVLARELHLDEIREIAGKCRAEIECFVHGALCFSISGQCYFSSYLGGHSGNRGRCTQPCRRLYRYRGKEGYYFSPNDFSSIDMIPQLADAGVASLKIEGRMKSAEYVACVVEAYRRVLDAAPAERQAVLADARELLKLSFGRTPTKGFLASHTPPDITTPSHRGATGRFLGEIARVGGGRITFESRDRLHVGDRIRIQPRSDMAGKGFTVKELFVNNRPVKVAGEKSVVTVVSPFPAQVKDAIFKVSSETAFTMSENACLKRLEGVKGTKLPCELAVALNGETLAITATIRGRSSTLEFHLGHLEPARTSDMAGVLAAQFGKCGDTPFSLAALTAPGFPPVLIPSARLKDIRRDFWQQLEERLLPELRTERERAKKRALASLAGQRPASSRGRSEVVVRVDHLRDMHLLHQEGVAALSFPVSRANLHQLPLMGRKLRGREDQIIWRLPFIIFEADLPFYREALGAILGWGFRRFEAANLGHFPLLREAFERSPHPASGHPLPTGEGRLQVVTDYRLFSLNSQAIRAWQELGAETVTLYVEDDAENLAALLAADLPVGRRVLVYGAIPVITSKIPIRGVKSDEPVVSDRGDEYLVTVKDNLTVITPQRHFSLTGQRHRLQEMGCSSFVIDLGQLSQKEWPGVFDAFARGYDLPGTTPFNFSMGLV
jgi:U32 family peptidase